MPTGDLPTFTSSNYASTAYGGIGAGNFNWNSSQQLQAADMMAQFKDLTAVPKKISKKKTFIDDDFDEDDEPTAKLRQTNVETAVTAPARRLVQVIIVDPNDNIPLDQCLLYKGDPKLTDATDQELFFELDIKDMLAKHNAERVKLFDKKVKDRVEHLEPAKVRDLKMVVVNIASF